MRLLRMMAGQVDFFGVVVCPGYKVALTLLTTRRNTVILPRMMAVHVVFLCVVVLPGYEEALRFHWRNDLRRPPVNTTLRRMQIVRDEYAHVFVVLSRRQLTHPLTGGPCCARGGTLCFR